MSLLTLLEEELKQRNKRAGRRESDGAPSTVCLYRGHRDVGIVGPLHLREANTLKALRRIKHERLAKLRKSLSNSDIAEYSERAYSVYTELRILVERLIEMELLADVVVRFRRAVQTNGRWAA